MTQHMTRRRSPAFPEPACSATWTLFPIPGQEHCHVSA
jgi:hypothetical protein